MKGKEKKITVASIAQLDNNVIRVWEENFNARVEEIFIYKKPTRESTIKFHVNCIKVAWKVLKKSDKEDNIILWQQFIGIYYGVFTRIFHAFKNPTQCLVLTFIFMERKGLLGKMYKSFIKYAISSPSISKLVSHSEAEVNFLKKTFPSLANKFEFCLLGEGSSIKFNDKNKSYFFSGGSSNRDYKTLIEAFQKNKKPLMIACKNENIEGLKFPENVKIHYNAYGENFISLICASKAAIVLVKDNRVSSGQLVVLNAMRCGKPIIATNGAGMINYLNPSYSILVEPFSVRALCEAVNKIDNDPELEREMAKNAYDHYNEFFTIEKYALRIYEILRENF